MNIVNNPHADNLVRYGATRPDIGSTSTTPPALTARTGQSS